MNNLPSIGLVITQDFHYTHILTDQLVLVSNLLPGSNYRLSVYIVEVLQPNSLRRVEVLRDQVVTV
jgi:hypothetical protein